MNRILGTGVFLVIMAFGTRASAATIVSGDGEFWQSNLASICGGAPSCSGSTTLITPHPLWMDDALTVPAARWVSYDHTGVTPDGVVAPYAGSAENPSGTTPIIWIDESFNAVVGSLLSVTFWADDTADVYLNDVLMFAGNFTQDKCAQGSIGCEPDESWTLNHTITQTHNVLRVVGYQVGSASSNETNPFGLLYTGSYQAAPVIEPQQVPEPTSLALFGLGLTAVATFARRRR